MDQGKEFMTWESEAAFRALFEYATIGIIVVDHAGSIVMLNPNAENLFDYKSGEVTGHSVEKLIPARFHRRHEAHRRNYTQNPKPRVMGQGLELYGVKKNGEEFPVEISLSNYELAAQNMTVAFISDISERKRLQDREKNYLEELETRVKERTKELTESLEREKELSDLKSRFVAMASHEFRIPLSTILTSASLIEKYDQNGNREKKLKHIERVKSSVKMMNEMLVDFLSLEKLENNSLRAEPELFVLGQLIEEVKNATENDLKAGQYMEIDAPEESMITIDPKLLKYILVNLISNAAKYSAPDKRIILKFFITAEEIHVIVADEGIGIPEEEHDQIFNTFFRASNAQHEKGTGLGLNLVKKYVELMKGTIRFESELEKGTTFHLHIPQKSLL